MTLPSHTLVSCSLATLPFAVVLAPGGCERSRPTPVQNTSEPAQAPPERSPAVLVFPDEVHTDDPQVNELVSRALDVTAGQDYEEFRLLWAADDEPFARDQFERGWQSLKRISVDLIQKMRDPRDNVVFYALYARAELDPQEIPPDEEAKRDIVLVIRRENDQWRLAHAPERVRDVVKDLMESKRRRLPAGETTGRKPAPRTDETGGSASADDP